MNVQIIERDGNPEWAVIPYKEYLRLVAEAEMLHDVRDYNALAEAFGKGEREIIPAEVVYAILDGGNPHSCMERISSIDPEAAGRHIGNKYALSLATRIGETHWNHRCTECYR